MSEYSIRIKQFRSILPGPALSVALLLAISTISLFGRACSNGFVNYDDPDYVTENAHVQAGLSLEGFWWALTSFEASNWHPLTWISLQMDREIYGLTPWGFHLTNVLLHAASAVLLFAIFLKMTGSLWKSALVGALFAWHPLHVESVAWVTERKDVLSALFWMLTMGAYIAYVAQPGRYRYLVLVLTFGLGLTSKPILVTLPCVLLLLDYWPLRRIQREDRQARSAMRQVPLAVAIGEKAPLLALAAICSALTLVAQRDALPTSDRFSLDNRLGNAVVSYVVYIAKAFWPIDLIAFYPYPMPARPAWQVVGGLFLLAGLTGAMLAIWRRRPYWIVGWMWYLITLIPVMGFVQVGTQALADRYMYLPLIGLSLMISWALADAFARWRVPWAVSGAVTLTVLAGLAAATWIQIGYWRDSNALWLHALKVVPDNWMAHANLGAALTNDNELQAAVHHEAEAVRLNPRHAIAHANLGVLLARQGDLPSATDQFQEAARLQPANTKFQMYLAQALMQTGRLTAAIRPLEAVLKLRPRQADAHHALGCIHQKQGHIEEAVEHYREALRINANLVAAHNNLGLALMQRGNLREASQHFEAVLRSRPYDAEALRNLDATHALQQRRRLHETREDVPVQEGGDFFGT
jgi:tetratricopeptide (TPR) repeat protein